MTLRAKPPESALPSLPLEYSPRLAEASDEKHERHYLLPGRVFASAEAVAITTIVGSSVVLCLWDPVNKCGGAIHFILPEARRNDPNDTRCADAGGEMLLRLMLDLGANLHGLEAKIFGGLQPAVKFGNSPECLGNRNVEAALKFLAAKGIRLVHTEAGGSSGRKVIFHTDDGCTWSESI